MNVIVEKDIANDNIDYGKLANTNLKNNLDVVNSILKDVDNILSYSEEDQKTISDYKELYLLKVYENITKKKPVANSIEYNQFVVGYDRGTDAIKEYFKEAYTKLRVLYFQERILNNLKYTEKKGDIFYNNIIKYVKDLHELDQSFDFKIFHHHFIDSIVQDLHGKGLLSLSL